MLFLEAPARFGGGRRVNPQGVPPMHLLRGSYGSIGGSPEFRKRDFAGEADHSIAECQLPQMGVSKNQRPQYRPQIVTGSYSKDTHRKEPNLRK